MSGKNSKIGQLIKDGYYFSAKFSDNQGITELALLSLKNGLKAFFSTYYSGDPFYLGTIDFLCNETYAIDFYQSVIFIHHFFELILKDILRSENELLALKFDDKNSDLILKLVNGKSLNKDDLSNLKSIEFTAALSRICHLIDKGMLKDFGFIKKEREALTELNNLRNRILHKGEYIVRYSSFDRFICKYILPVIDSLLKLPLLGSAQIDWKYKKLACGIDPIEEIIAEAKKDDYSEKKVALLKEMARAAYNNPLFLYPAEGLPQQYNSIEERIAISKWEIDQEEKICDIVACPVCGARTAARKSGINKTNRHKYIKGLICSLCKFRIGLEFREIIEKGEVPGIDKNIFDTPK